MVGSDSATARPVLIGLQSRSTEPLNPAPLLRQAKQDSSSMAAVAARSLLRSSSLRSAAAKFASKPRSAPSSFRLPKPLAAPRLLRFRLPFQGFLLCFSDFIKIRFKRTLFHLFGMIFRSPVESTFCVESLLPMHSVTAAALMTSMLSASRGGYGWLIDGDFISP